MENTWIIASDLKAYTKVIPGNTDEGNLLDTYCSAACNIVTSYLGYNPVSSDYTKVLDGSGKNYLVVPSLPVTKVNSLMIDGNTANIANISFDGQFIYRPEIFNKGDRNIIINYTAGYDIIPGIMSITALRIAALLQTESSGNIGVTSRSFGDDGSRSFYKTKFDDYLEPLVGYRRMIDG